MLLRLDAFSRPDRTVLFVDLLHSSSSLEQFVGRYGEVEPACHRENLFCRDHELKIEPTIWVDVHSRRISSQEVPVACGMLDVASWG